LARSSDRPPLTSHQFLEEKKFRLPCSRASRACSFEPLVPDASMTAVPIDMPLITTLRIGNEYLVGGADGENSETSAPRWPTIASTSDLGMPVGSSKAISS